MPTKTTKKHKSTRPVLRYWKQLCVVLLVITLIVHGVVLWFLVRNRPTQDNQHIAGLIVRAVEQINRPVPIDAQTGRLYFAAAKLTLPAVPLDLGELVYLYSVTTDGSVDELRIASLSDIRTQEGSVMNYSHDTKAMFDQVPKLQACSRGITMKFQATENHSPTATKQLVSGKMLYLYSEPLCENAELMDYVHQIDSY